MSDLKTVFAEMEKRFKPGVLDEPYVIYFSLGDGEDDKWTLSIEPDACHVRPGKVDNADCFLKTDRDLFIKMLAGKYSPGPMDFMLGKVKSNDPLKLKDVLEKVFPSR